VPLIAVFKSFTHFQNNKKDWNRFFFRIQGDQKLHFLVITDVKGSCLKLVPAPGRLESHYKTQLPGSIASISLSFAGTLVPVISVPLEVFFVIIQ
jgi:hypothetical protein